MTLRLSGLFIYPVKSARGLTLSEVQVTPRGLANDRRFMIVDAAGHFVTQRQAPQLARLVPELAGAELRLRFEGLPPLCLPLQPSAGAALRVTVWRDQVDALDCGDEAAGLCGAVLGCAARLAYMPESSLRQVNPSYASAGDLVSFADSFPFLVTNQGSLDELNGRLAEPVPMDRFRPNLVVEGAFAYAEDGWSRLQIGEVPFEVRKPCDRCLVITTDQLSGERLGKEPLKTLAGYHTWNGKSAFGQNLLARAPGTLRLGDRVLALP